MVPVSGIKVKREILGRWTGDIFIEDEYGRLWKKVWGTFDSTNTGARYGQIIDGRIYER